MAERVFALPDLGEGLEEATVTSWLVAEGDEVELNQPIAEVETAKAVVEIPSPYAGVIARLHVEAGGTIAVGAPLVTFSVGGEKGSPAPATPGESSRVAGLGGAGSGRDEPPAPAGAGSPSVSATPAVRAFARELGVDLGRVRGTGPGGRITREDVEGASASGDEDVEIVPVTAVRRAVAKRLAVTAGVPQVTTFRTVECSAWEALRGEAGVSPLPVFVRALATVAAEHRWINASWGDEAIRQHGVVNVGVAVDTERGLVVPVVRDAGSLGIGAIADEIARLAEAARANALARSDVAGSTIAVTNTGSYGSEFGTPLLNPGHAVTIGLGVIGPRAIVVDGRVEARPVCTLSTTFDHRVLDGATVGRALGALVALLESETELRTLPR